MVSVDTHLDSKIAASYVNRLIKSLLKIIPSSHVIGLDKIIVFSEMRKKNDSAAGLYWPAHHNKPATVEISLNAVFGDRSMIKLFIPFIGKLLIAHVLYHEIGHHYHHRMKHGINKHKREDFAENYSKKMTGTALRKWRWIVRPLVIFVQYLLNIFGKG